MSPNVRDRVYYSAVYSQGPAHAAALQGLLGGVETLYLLLDSLMTPVSPWSISPRLSME